MDFRNFKMFIDNHFPLKYLGICTFLLLYVYPFANSKHFVYCRFWANAANLIFFYQNCFKSFHQFSSVAQLCSTHCDPMNSSTPVLPVHHQLPEFTQTHIHRVSDAIQPSHPLSSPSPPALNPSQHQSLFQWVNSSHEVAKVLELQF